MKQDDQQIRATVDAFGQAMKAMDLPALQALWDREHEHLVYQPEEYERACRTWDEIVEYWSYIPSAVSEITEWRSLDVDVDVLGDAALVYAVFSTTFVLRDVGEPLSGDVRFSLGLRRVAGDWRFVHCHESRQLVV
jgi:ketosteroid isomerase-like protein